MKKPKYLKFIVVGPVAGGTQWWCVRGYPNDDQPDLATFSIACPGARREAHDLCKRLNAELGTKEARSR